MKRVLSTMLAGVMLVSAFAMNVSAKIIPEDAEKLVLSETFDGEAHVFTTGTAGSVTAGATEADGNAFQAAITGAEVNLPQRYALEFDMMIPAAADHHIYLNDADSQTVANVGVRLQSGTVTPETWYRVKVVVDESLMSGTCDNNGQKAIILYQMAKGGTEWTLSKHQYGTNAVVDPTSGLIQYRPHTGNAKAAIGEYAIGFSANMIVDNVKLYNLTYGLEVGTICYTAESITMPTYAGKDDLNAYTYKYSPVAPEKEGDVAYVIATFDAKNTVKGLPLALHISGADTGVLDTNYVCTVSILSNDEAAADMYTYKIVSKMVYGNRDMSVDAVYRKAASSNAEYELLAVGNDYIVGDGGRISSGVGNIRFGYRNSNIAEAYGYSSEEGATNDFTATSWEVENVQVLYGNAVLRGFVDKADGVLNVETAIVSKDDTAAAIVAAYAGNRLVDVDFDNLTDGEGDAELTVDFDNASNTAKLFIWKTLDDAPVIEALGL